MNRRRLFTTPKETIKSLIIKSKRGPLFYWRFRRYESAAGKCYFWMTPWSIVWFLWNSPWFPSENGDFLFKGIAIESGELRMTERLFAIKSGSFLRR